MSLGGCGSEILSQFFKIVSELNGGTGEFLHWRRIDGLLRPGQAGELMASKQPAGDGTLDAFQHEAGQTD